MAVNGRYVDELLLAIVVWNYDLRLHVLTVPSEYPRHKGTLVTYEVSEPCATYVIGACHNHFYVIETDDVAHTLNGLREKGLISLERVLKGGSLFQYSNEDMFGLQTNQENVAGNS
ncbi:hypothetical protein DIPPA_62393 [Diplonema papillatum]|nr:hypothetical protein DIPPA_63831 [Diplonema papillatum]KAJ9437346.1 hypothetical protein DIPPA_56569 [Diplonema papillatum]KAJ9437400.1 hypothetical protein DIPPA_54973 [Diplonema papillatum]KAJ9438412.1 hypothetical protein DIPPA_56581 [Diplonema papillatum]KAJ9439616.1 hypothetical protein DIPPA_65165 [Diplonema papillatum]